MNKTCSTAIALALYACASLTIIAPANAQSIYGSIFGTVSDSTGAAVAGALITVKDEAKGTVVTTTSNTSGDYSVPHLIPDVYDLRVTSKGFKSFETKGIQVQADTAPRVDPTLDVGGGSETVEVNAETQPELKTDRADVSTVFDQQQVSSLPVGDQNFTNLQLLLPGAQVLGWSHAANENPQGSKQIQIDGQAFGGTAFELDGTDNQDPILGIIVINPAMDSVTETKITTQNFDAELGKAVSAVVTAQTRSGTNKFHGSAYDFRTGNANLARDPFNQPPGPGAIPPGLKNRFGGSIGGPVLKDKAFFFGNYEAQRQKVGVSNTASVPTAHLVATCLGSQMPIAGTVAGCDFSEYAAILNKGGQLIYDQVPDTANPGKTVSVAFPNNVIPAGRLSTPALNLLKIMQAYAPNNGGAFSPANTNFIGTNYAAGGTGSFNSNQWTARGDYTLNEKMHAFARFSRFWDTLSGKVMFGEAGGPGFGLGNPPYGGTSQGANDSLASGMDIALSSKLLTDFRLGYYRYNINNKKYDQGVAFATTLGIPKLNTDDPNTSGAPRFQIDSGEAVSKIGGGLDNNRCNCPLKEREDQAQIVNNWTIIKGSHSLKVGVDLRYARNLRFPSDADRSGQLDFHPGPTSNAGSLGNGFASFMLGNVSNFSRYISVSGNAKEFQKRTFFYGQDTWRVTHNLTLNLGLRWELYFPEKVNATGNGSLMNLADGYMHVAGIGGISSNMGWDIQKAKAFDPRIGLTYQLDTKTVIRAGYGRSFDTGVFGSIFGHVVTQNLPVLATQNISPNGNTGTAFNMADGPTDYSFPAIPSNGLLPAQAYSVQPKARPNPLHLPTIDAWNLAVQRALTPTLTLTLAYVGNKGTHTLGDTNQNNTDPNESALFLPGTFSVTGQTLHADPAATGNTINPDGGVSNAWYLKRYFGGSLPACKDPNYISLAALKAADSKNGVPDTYLQPGMCGWTNGIAYYGDDENTEFDALQITLAKQFSKGFAMTGNYQWAAAFGDANNFWTWSHTVTHYRDSNVRPQSLTVYGSYDLPFGRGKQYAAGINKMADLLIGGYQLSTVLNWSGGLPFGVGYDQFNPWPGPGPQPADWNVEDCSHNVGASNAPCRPNTNGGHMKTKLTDFDPVSHKRSFFAAQPRTGGIFSFPGLDKIGNASNNTYLGPSFFNDDLAITKTFTIHESIATKFRMDAFNAFNHINPGQPNNTDVFGSVGTNTGDQLNNINGEAPGALPRQLEFSLRVQF